MVDTNSSGKPAPRRFAGRSVKQKKQSDPFAQFMSLGGFFIGMGLLIGATGLIIYLPFHNKISKLVLAGGFILCLLGFAIKVLDILMKIIGDRK